MISDMHISTDSEPQSNKLYTFPLSPFCRKLRQVLCEKKIPVEVVEEKYWEKRGDFMRMSPAGRVPVLRYGGRVLSESHPICEYLETLHPEPPLIPEDPEDIYEMRRLVNWFDEKFYREVTSKLVNERVLKRLRGNGFPEAQIIAAALRNLRFHLDYMHHLLNRRRWLAGDRMSLADFAASSQLSCLDFIGDIDWTRSSNIKNWYSTMKSRPAFRPLLTEEIPGYVQPEHYSDLDF